MKKRINRLIIEINRSKIKTTLFSVSIILIALLISLILFMFTPLVRSLGIVGDGRLIATERVFNNIISLDENTTVNELIFRYFIGKEQDEVIDYNRIVRAISQIDSLNNEVELWRAYAYNINQILEGTKKTISADSIIELGRQTGSAEATRSALDTLLRNQVTTQLEKLESENKSLSKYRIYPPVNGQITVHFNYRQKINGLTFSTTKVSPVMSVGEGSVISSDWTPKDGFTIQIQHPNNMISIYKGVTRPLKEAGSRVGAREVIGYIGGNNDDKIDTLINVLSPQSANNLYFEMWQNGNRIDPEKYIIF